jgi:hypothetical protein
MFQKLLFCLLVLSSLDLRAAIKKAELKIDHNWTIQYDKAQWSYLFVKPFNSISSHILESKQSGLQLILQKEHHSFANESLDSLIKNKCLEANRYYQAQRNGSAEINTIGGQKFCYIEYKNVENKQMALFVFPKKINKYSYDLLTYSWKQKSIEEKKEVVALLAGVNHK